MKTFVATLTTALLLATHTQASDQPDSGLVLLVSKVSIAASREDYDALYELMVDDFRYSFGGDRSRMQAIDWYMDRPELLIQLNAVLSGDCALTEFGKMLHYVCPAAAVTSDKTFYDYRAGFRLKDGSTWEFVWFIAGD